MLRNVGLDNVNPSECNVSLFKSHIQSKFISQWKNAMSHSNTDYNVGTGNKLRTFALFKGSFIYEPYLNIVQNKNERKELTRLRISAHKLAIESGRYTRPYTPVYDRKCKGNAPGSNKHAVQQKMSRNSPNYWCPTDLSNMLLMTYLQSQKEVTKGQE